MKEKKPFNIQLPHDLWVFLKKEALKHDTTMSKVIIEKVLKYKQALRKNS